MRFVWLAWLAFAALPALTGCRELLGLDDPTPGSTDAPGPDATLTCFGHSGWEICTDSIPAAIPGLSGVFDTDSDARCMSPQHANWTTADQPAACIVVAAQITTYATTFVTGSRPLVLIAQTSITIPTGTLLDGASHHGSASGPAALGASCPSFATTPGNAITGGGGGAGASFGSLGASGGGGNGGAAPGGTMQAIVGAVPVMRAGCRGQSGGDGNVAAPGVGGVGGGALYLVAGNTIVIDGAVDTSGGGGIGGSSRSGGGGGGSGGLIAVFAPMVTGSGAIVANGGGGGAGGENSQTAGGNGFDPVPSNPLVHAAGGVGQNGAGNGGQGAAATAATAGITGSSGRGGGGGGGGTGIVLSNVGSMSVTFSPAPTAW